MNLAFILLISIVSILICLILGHVGVKHVLKTFRAKNDDVVAFFGAKLGIKGKVKGPLGVEVDEVTKHRKEDAIGEVLEIKEKQITMLSRKALHGRVVARIPLCGSQCYHAKHCVVGSW